MHRGLKNLKYNSSFIEQAQNAAWVIVNENYYYWTGQGYTVVYQQPYLGNTATAHLDSVRNQCGPSDKLIMAGGQGTTFIAGAMDNCRQALIPTGSNSDANRSPNHGNLYWYNRASWSFGYATVQQISLNSADTCNVWVNCGGNADWRTSWHTHGWVGGWRVGRINCLNSDNRYTKFLLISRGKPACTQLISRDCDESINNIGAFRCNTYKHCRTGRYCNNQGVCANFPNGKPPCTDRLDSFCDESINKGGPGKCSADADCYLVNNLRECFNGNCRQKLPPCSNDGVDRRNCDERRNARGANRCFISRQCAINRYCSQFGSCNDIISKPPCTDLTTRNCDESINVYGPGKCESNDNHCAAGRICAKGICDNPPPSCNVKRVAGCAEQKPCVRALNCQPGNYCYQQTKTCIRIVGKEPCTLEQTRDCDEAKNYLGAGKCAKEIHCALGRQCHNGSCRDKPPEIVIPACSDNKSRDCDEAKNKGGDGVCDESRDCRAGRYCTPKGQCANIPKGAKLPCSDRVVRDCSEELNILGQSRCKADADCFAGRVCKAALGGRCDYKWPGCDATKDKKKCDEDLNALGPKRCKKSSDCAHGRYCTNLGTCANIPHGMPPCTDEDADEKNCDESINNLGDARCSDDKHCRGERVCNAGLCRAAYPSCDSRREREVCDEKINKLGPSKCKASLDCRVGRYCTKDGNCEGWIGNDPPCSDRIKVQCDERMNILGASRCYSANDCTVGRFCNAKGNCEDKPKPVIVLADPPKQEQPAPRIIRPEEKKKVEAKKPEPKKEEPKKNENCVILYSECEFKGKSITICEDTPHLGHKGWTVKIRSIRIPEGYEVFLYSNTYYQGKEEKFTQSVKCMKARRFRLLQLSAHIQTNEGIKLRFANKSFLQISHSQSYWDQFKGLSTA